MEHRVSNQKTKHNFGRIVKIGLALLLAGLLSACGEKKEAMIIVAGSTSVQPFAEALAEHYMVLHKEIEVDVQGGGSSAGVMSAKTNTADIGMSSRNLKEDELSLWHVEIARDGLAVIVNPKNNVTDLTLKQVREIYSGVISNWSQLGGKDAKIHIIAREEGSGTRSAFESLVMDKHEISPRAIVQDSNGTVRQLVADDPNAIGFVSLGLVDKTVIALKLDGVSATRENVLNQTYNLSRPFIFITSAEPTGETKKFIDFVISEEGKKILNDEGLVTFETGGAQ